MTKATDYFAQAIKMMLDKRAEEDELFAQRYGNDSKSITECCDYIIGEVSSMGVTALSDDEVLGLAVHYYDEDSVFVKAADGCHVVSPALPELTADIKAELQKRAEQDYYDEMLAKMRQSNKVVKAPKAEPTKWVEQSLFQ